MRIVILSTLATVALISAATCGAETGPSPAGSGESIAHRAKGAGAQQVTTDSRQAAEPPSELTQDHEDRRARHASRD